MNRLSSKEHAEEHFDGGAPATTLEATLEGSPIEDRVKRIDPHASPASNTEAAIKSTHPLSPAQLIKDNLSHENEEAPVPLNA